MRGSKALVRRLAADRGIDVDLFEHDAEWALTDALVLLYATDDQVVELNLLEDLIAK